ncbi:hypothetical protein [Candidatus Avelusimicrobium stercoris]|uniref:hypothetical protein n=1 Tax=Candidatus Avelusimicrobium stercoris TaxID=1947924 RepID=UPI003D0DC520
MLLRKMLALVGLVLLSVPGFSWRFIDYFANSTQQGSKVPLVSRLVRGETLPYFVHIRGPWNLEKLDDIFVRSFNSWRIYTLQELSEARREKEFKDVVKTLQTPWKFEMWPYLSCADFEKTPWQELARPVAVANLPQYLEMYPAHCSPAVRERMDNYSREVQDSFSSSYVNMAQEQAQNQSGRYVSWEAVGQALAIDEDVTSVYTDSTLNALFVPLLDTDSLFHEMGHLLGFADQYPITEDEEYSLEYGLSGYWPSIMQNGAETKDYAYFSCTDADGMINLLDFVNQHARGGKKGWKTLCRLENIQYASYRQLNRPPFVVPPYVYFYNEKGEKLYSRKEEMDVYAPITLPCIPYYGNLHKGIPQTDGTLLVTASGIEEHLYYTPMSVSAWVEDPQDKRFVSVFTLIFLPDGDYVYWQDPWYSVIDRNDIKVSALVGDSQLLLIWKPEDDLSSLGLSAISREQAGKFKKEDAASTFIAVKDAQDDTTTVSWESNPQYPEYDTYLKSVIKLMGNDLDDKNLRKNTYVMALLSLIGKGVENADWEKIGSGMIDFMRNAYIEYGNEYQTDKVWAFLDSFQDVHNVLWSTNFLNKNWSEVFKTGNPAKWQEVMQERDTIWTGSPQICANEPTDFYPADNPLKATKWCPEN